MTARLQGSGQRAEAVLGVDVGGTFTDAVLLANGRVFSAKVPTTDPQSHGVLTVAQTLLRAAGVPPEGVARFIHGMTVATNALLERKGARVALVTTEGFRDILTIGRQERAELYTLYPQRPAPLVPREWCVGVRERVGPEGVRLPLSDGEVERVCALVASLEPEAVAVGLLWSFLDPRHERRLGEALRRVLKGVPVVTSAELAPVFREVERIGTAVADAYLTPRTQGYLRDLAAACAQIGLRQPEIMESSGGTVPLERAAEHAARLLLSGPAGGVVAGLVVRLPAVDIHTVSAGGGSIAWVDAGGALKVGPRSAGARPGPACYGYGGREATVTDANVVLGRIAPGVALGGTLELDPALAWQVIGDLGVQAGLPAVEAAEGVLRVAVFNMAAAVRKVTFQRGIDPRDHVLVAFGGAGGLHACALAEEVGIRTVMLPVRAGVLSAVGLVAASPRADQAATVMWEAESVSREAWRQVWADLEARVLAGLAGRVGEVTPVLRREVEARYRGQSHELRVVLPEGTGPEALCSLFHRAHRERYGYDETHTAVELLTLRAVGVCPPTVPLPADEVPGLRLAGSNQVFVAGRWESCPVYVVEEGVPLACRQSPGGTRSHRGFPDDSGRIPNGPAVIAATEFSAFVPPGWRVSPVPGALVLVRNAAGEGSRRG